MRFRSISRCLPALAAAALVSPCVAPITLAQVMQNPGVLPDGRQAPGAWQRAPLNPRPMPNQIPPGRVNPANPDPNTGANPSSPAPSTPKPSADVPAPGVAGPSAPTALTAPSLLDKPAQPAKVALAGGQLSVDANNSSLSEILHQLATSSGMTIDGLGEDSRIFGTYGPGNPRDILSSLLDGAGYNVLMIGATDSGTPREVLLTQRTKGPLAQSQPSNLAQRDEDQDETMPPPPAPAGEVPPSPPSPMTPQNPNGTPRSPQQMLQEMRMRAQQQQQQPDQQQQQPPPQ
jgi:hypothetical protein